MNWKQVDRICGRAAQPLTLKTLTSTINSLFQKQLSEEDLVELLEGRQAIGIINVNDTKVTYTLPASEA